MQLSTLSLLLMSGVGVLISAISLIFLWFANRDIRAARYWALSPCFFTISMLLFALQDLLPIPLRFILPNFFAQGAFLLIIIGLYLACDKAIPKRFMMAYFTAYAVLHSLFSSVLPSYQSRFILGVIMVTLSSTWIICILYRFGRSKYRVSSLLICISLLLMFSTSANKLLMFNGQSTVTLQQDTTFETQLFVIALFASQLLFNFAFAIMIGEYRNQKNKRYQTELIEINHQLEQAKQDAEHHSQLKSEFLANMSHEIRTPINGVIGSLELIKEHELTSQQARYKVLASSSAYTLLGVINDILDFSKIESGKLTLHLEEFDIYQLIDSVVKSFSIDIAKKGLTFQLDTHLLNAQFIYGDPIRIRQVITNLLSNAIKFTQKGHVKLSVKLVQSNDQNWILEGDVLDTGIGIEAHATDKLFQSFSQCDASTTRVFGGTGLGLTIVKSLCQMMQGDALLISSEKGKGTHFRFSASVEVNDKSSRELPKFMFTKVALYSKDQTLKTNLENEFNKYAITLNLITQLPQSQQKDSLLIVDLCNSEIAPKDLNNLLATYQDKNIKVGFIVTPRSELEQQFSSHSGLQFMWHKPVTAFDVIKLSTCHKRQQQAPSLVDLSGLKLLIAEDNPVNLIITEQILANWNVNFTSAKTGKEVLAILKGQKAALFDLILMDCQMPELDGYETTKVIRNDPSFSHCKTIPIIALTANAMKGDDEHCFLVGMNGYVSKPINPENLLAEIKKVISKTNLAQN
ncbi:ATP-binding protein [Pseudoalteromonas sp. SSM20]|uniref:ATP-binding protein n=1 Tax=Pseudoalteromonas sp. SSM20 TaxID=3139394 RepID=UPI003BAA6DD9